MGPYDANRGQNMYISRTVGWPKFLEKGDLKQDRPVFYFQIRMKSKSKWSLFSAQTIVDSPLISILIIDLDQVERGYGKKNSPRYFEGILSQLY